MKPFIGTPTDYSEKRNWLARPVDPGNRADPTNPADPTSPTGTPNPADPGNRADPTNPADPGNPADSTNPAGPGNRADQHNPAGTTNPAGPDNRVSKPNPAGTTDPADPLKPVDLFFLYPSSCNDPKAGVICTVDNRSMRKGAKRNFSHQATAFAPVANIFAPFWRQVNATKLNKMTYEEVDEAEWAEPRTDVYAALDYYFEHLNQGRPYFLAGHSQGSRLCYMVLAEYMKEHPEYYEKMIAAYCLGDSLTEGYLEENPHVKAAKSGHDLGVVVSWNTEGLANKGRPSLVVSPGAISINPLNWRTDDTPAPAELNLGCFIPNLLFHGLIKLPVKADAVLYPPRGTVMVTEPRLKRFAITAIPGFKKLEPVFGPASYHGCDYSFFFLNIRENARARAEAWFDARK